MAEQRLRLELHWLDLGIDEWEEESAMSLELMEYQWVVVEWTEILFCHGAVRATGTKC